jgi:UPF0271 protein|tara:strand:- start:51 stop:800 length:750 start_codon:yes stop_codon:yes gene_type:complete
MKSKKIDINCDMGESYYDIKVGNDYKIMPFITSCNIACGFHGGDPKTISNTIDYALDKNVKIGAHPSFHDIKGFGRKIIKVSNRQLKNQILYQVSALKGMVESKGGRLNHIKPHGALYNMASIDDEIAKTIVKVIKNIDPNLKLYGPSMLRWKNISENIGINYVSEVFSDRNYNDDLTLVNRNNNKAMITNPKESLRHVERMVKEKTVKSIKGNLIPIIAETICVHGDQPNAIDFAKIIYDSFKIKKLI